MKLPRDVDAAALIKGLARIGYAPVRQTGSHVRLQFAGPPEHAITVPMHSPLRVGTLSGILAEVGRHHGITRAELLARLFGD